MKTRKFYRLLIILLLLFLFTSCASSENTGTHPDNNDSSTVPPINGSENNYSNGIIVDPFVDGEGKLLTGFAYDDNNHYRYWLSLQQSENGIFKNFANNSNLCFITNNRIKVTLPKNLDAVVSLLDRGNVVYSAFPNIDGTCYLFPKTKQFSYDIKIDYFLDGVSYSEEHTIINDTKFEITGDTVYKDEIDLMFVVDTTGSMMDELMYLKSKIADIAERISIDNNCVLNIAILLYRDLDSSYVTLYSDFNSNVRTQQLFLEDKIASEGGDYQEAVDIALNEALNKDWGNKNTTKVIVHIADAPAHDEDLGTWYDVTLKLASKGVKIITVASAAINAKTEYLFRSQSLITNGTYVSLSANYVDVTNNTISFETDVVLRELNDCLVRLISSYHTGNFIDPSN